MSISNRTASRPRSSARSVGLIAATALLLSAVGQANAQRTAAQSTDDARWLPWVGCWQRSADPGAATPLTCVRPGASSSADILSIVNGAVESRERIVVDGQPHPIERDGCSGTQTATWSTSGNRIYIGSAYTCSGGLRGRSTRMFAILPTGVWLEIRDVHSGGGWVETVTRFHDAGLPHSVPAEIRSEISHRELAIATARAAASAPVSASDVGEAMRSVDTAVVQSWLAARGQAFAADSNVAAGAPSQVRVYEGSPAPAAPPRQSAEMLETGCDPFGCYAPNGYSSFNGMVFTPYARTYGYGFGPSYYVPYVAPVVVIRGGGRVNPRGGQPSGHLPWLRTPPVHTPLGHTNVGHSPVGRSPGGYSPGGPLPPRYTPSPSQPPAQAPRGGGIPGRIRP